MGDGRAVGRRRGRRCARALQERGLPFQVDAGGGAFYGPKIDMKIKDSLGRAWQCTTIQFDFNVPERFDMTFIGEDGKEHRPYMIHRALLGSMERFFGCLIEHYAGAFPLWLAPVQATIIPISRREAHGLRRARCWRSCRRRACAPRWTTARSAWAPRSARRSCRRCPYMLIIGDKERDAGTVSVRLRCGEDLGAQPVDALIARMTEEAASKR